jgi:hypothetical protein
VRGTSRGIANALAALRKRPGPPDPHERVRPSTFGFKRIPTLDGQLGFDADGTVFEINRDGR